MMLVTSIQFHITAARVYDVLEPQCLYLAKVCCKLAVRKCREHSEFTPSSVAPAAINQTSEWEQSKVFFSHSPPRVNILLCDVGRPTCSEAITDVSSLSNLYLTNVIHCSKESSSPIIPMKPINIINAPALTNI